MPNIREIRTLPQLDAARLRWSLQLQQTRGASANQTLDCLRSQWHSADAWRIIEVCSAGDTIGILPLAVELRSSRWGTARVLRYFQLPFQPFCGPVGGNTTATLYAGLRYLASTTDTWDQLELAAVDRHGRDGERTPTAFDCAGLHYRREPWQRFPLIEVEQFRESSQSPLIRPQRQTALTGELSARFHFQRCRPSGSRYADGEVNPDFARWMTNCEPTGRFQESSLRGLWAAAASCGMLDHGLLRLRGQVVGAFWGTCSEGDVAIAAWRVSDPQFLGPLALHLLKDSIDRGDHRIWSPADSPWEGFKTRDDVSYVYRHHRRSLYYLRTLRRVFGTPRAN